MGGDVRSIAVDNQGNVFAATNGNGVYRSSDDGNTWTQVANGLNNLRIQSLVSGFGFILAGTDGGGIFISYDQGEHWKQTNNGLSNLGIGALLVDLKGIIYAGSLSDFGCTGVYRSLDTAKSWLQTGLQNGCIRSLAASPENTIFAAGDNGIYRSTDDGITWVSVSNFGSRSIAVNENGKIYAARFGGLNYSSDNGNTWLPTGLTEGNIIAVAVKKFGYVFAGRWGDGVLTSTNNGTTWNHWSEGLSGFIAFILQRAKISLQVQWATGCADRLTMVKHGQKQAMG